MITPFPYFLPFLLTPLYLHDRPPERRSHTRTVRDAASHESVRMSKRLRPRWLRDHAVRTTHCQPIQQIGRHFLRQCCYGQSGYCPSAYPSRLWDHHRLHLPLRLTWISQLRQDSRCPNSPNLHRIWALHSPAGYLISLFSQIAHQEEHAACDLPRYWSHLPLKWYLPRTGLGPCCASIDQADCWGKQGGRAHRWSPDIQCACHLWPRSQGNQRLLRFDDSLLHQGTLLSHRSCRHRVSWQYKTAKEYQKIPRGRTTAHRHHHQRHRIRPRSPTSLHQAGQLSGKGIGTGSKLN